MICFCAHVGTSTFCKVVMQEKHFNRIANSEPALVPPSGYPTGSGFQFSLERRAMAHRRPKYTGHGEGGLSFKLGLKLLHKRISMSIFTITSRSCNELIFRYYMPPSVFFYYDCSMNRNNPTKVIL